MSLLKRLTAYLLVIVLIATIQISSASIEQAVFHLRGGTYISVTNEAIVYQMKRQIDGSFGDLIELLNKAKFGDKVLIEIDSPGGYVNHGIQILNAILESDAEVTCKVTGYAASMAAVILLNCDKIELTEDSKIMFHLPSVGSFMNQPLRDPKVNEEFIKILNENNCFSEFMPTEAYFKFLIGFDVWFKKEGFLKHADKACHIKKGLMVQGYN